MILVCARYLKINLISEFKEEHNVLVSDISMEFYTSITKRKRADPLGRLFLFSSFNF